MRALDKEAQERLIEAMRSCEQAKGMNVHQHGAMVAAYYEDLIEHLEEGEPLAYEWRLPQWASRPEVLDVLPSRDVMHAYHVFHDCGKPFCLETDEEGRRHFPDHAAVSKRIWLEAGGDPEVGELIGMDMDAHLLKADGLEEFASRTQARALLLTALAEIHANAYMFGGIESVSFKIKWKHLDKRGRQVLDLMNVAPARLSA
tara:strand:+ start:1919 stop:2524 length:606 start_codon:yes stop_codon:yes gene_type:complete